MATRVKTDADTEIPCTMPLILQTRLPKGHPEDRRDAVSSSKQQQELISKVGVALKGIHKPINTPGGWRGRRDLWLGSFMSVLLSVLHICVGLCRCLSVADSKKIIAGWVSISPVLMCILEYQIRKR